MTAPRSPAGAATLLPNAPPDTPPDTPPNTSPNTSPNTAPTASPDAPPLPRVGVIGAGAMGWAMAMNLRRQGVDVAVRDTDPAVERAAREQGLVVHASPAALAAHCEVVVVAVVDAPQVDEVLFGRRPSVGGRADLAAPTLTAGPALLPPTSALPPPGSALPPPVALDAEEPRVPDGVVHARRSADRPAPTVLLCPTIAPDATESFARRLAEYGIASLDAPISGGPARAAAGTMSMMVAGDAAVVERCEPLLRRMASPLHRVGERVGDGARTKLVNNLLAGVHLAAGAEALALADRLGLDRQRLMDLVLVSSGASWILGDRAPRALAGDLQPPRARTGLLHKDLGLAVAMAERAGADAPIARLALATFQAAMADGRAGLDDAAVLRAPPSAAVDGLVDGSPTGSPAAPA